MSTHKLSACMIVKNEEEMLRKTLPNLLKGVDEVILVDTGSSDGTVQFAKECGANVFHFAWINDFSAARNESLKHATGDWIIWIDADEYVKPEDFQKLKELLDTTSSEAFLLPVHECPLDTFNTTSFYLRVKVFKNGKGYHFERPINEQVCDVEGKTIQGGLIKNVLVYHWGNFKTEEKMKQKKERNLGILEQLVERIPEDANCHFLLGDNYSALNRLEEAILEYQKTKELSADIKLAVSAQTKLAWCLYSLNRLKEAYQAAVEAVKVDENNISALNILGAILLQHGMLDQAISVLNQASQVKPGEQNSHSVEIKQKEYTINFLLGNAYLQKGNKAKAKEYFGQAAEFEMTAVVMQKLEELK